MAKPNLKKIEQEAYQNALNERFQLGKRYAEQSRENAMDLAQSISPGGSMTALNKGDVASFNKRTRRIAEIQAAQAIDYYRGTGMYNTPEYAYNKGLAHMSESAYLTNEEKRLAAQLLESEKKDAEWENGGRQEWYDFTTRQSSIKNKLAEMDAQGRNYYDLDALEEADLLWFDSVINGNERWKPNYSNAADVERYNALVDQWASVDDWENFDLAKHLGITAPEQYVSKTSTIQGNLNTVSGELERRQGLDALKADIRSNPNYETLSVYGGHEHVEGTLADRYDFDHYYDQQYFMNNPVLPEGFRSRVSQDLIDHYIQFGYDYLTPEELADYNALINAGRPEDAKKYLDLLSSELLARRGNVLNAEREVRAEHLGYGALDSAKTLIENPIGSAMTIAGGLFGIDDPNHPIYDTTRGVNTTREVYGQTLGELAPSAKLFDQNLLTMGYNVLMSVGDMAVAKGIGGGLAKAAGKGTNFAKNAMQFVMSSESAASTIMNDLERGWDVEQSMLHGLTNGLIEAWTERGFMDSLFSEGGTFLSRVLKSGMAEGLEEVESGSLQIVSDALFAKMGENESEVEEVYNAFAQTMTQGEAAKMTLMYYANQLAADGLSGFATGGLMQAGTNVAENTWSTNVGKQVQNEGDLESVLRIAEANKETTEAAGAAKRIREKQAKGVKVTARDMGELVTAVGNTIGEKNAAEITGVLDESITGRLEELGEDAENAKKLAPVIRNMYQGKKITSAERAGVEWTENAEQVVKEMTSTPKESAEVVPGAIEGAENQRAGKKWLTEAGGKIQAAQREGLMESMRFNEALTKKTSTTTDVGKAREKARNTMKGKPKMAARDFAYDTGEAAGKGTFERVRKENGRFKVVMKAEDGKTVEADVDSIRNAGDEGLLTILDYAEGGARHDMSEAEVNLLAATYAEQGGDVDATIQQFEDSYLAGYSGIANMTSGMDPKLASIAYEQGRAEAAKDEEQRIEEAKRIRANANPVTGWIGEVTSDDDVHGTGDAKALDAEYQNMTDGEQMVVDLGKELSRNTGLNVVYYRSKANAAGKYTTMNGSYDVRSHTIYLDVNAGNMSEADTARQRDAGTLGYAIMRTMGHEVTHAIETTSTEFYAKYKQAVKTELAGKGQDWARLVRKKLDNAVAGGRKMTYAEAEAEVVADASEYMLQDSKFVNDLDAGLKGKVKRVIQDFMKKVRAAFRQIISGGHEEARALLDGMGHYSKRLQDLWDAGFMEMSGKEVQADFADERGGNIKKSERDIDEYASVTEEDFHKNGRIYDYDFLIKQKPISVVVIPSVNTLMGSGSFKRTEIVEQGKNKIPGEENELGHKQVKNVYTGRTLSITNNTIRHGLNGDKTRILANAQIGLMIGDVVKNGIPINGLSTTDRNAIQTYAMVTPCVTEDGKAMMAVTHVDIQKNEVNSVTFTDLVHSANGRIYKKSEPGSYPIDVQGLSLHHPSRFTISISDLLEDVNMSFKSLLSDDVLNRLGEKRPDKGLYTGKVLYSRRENQTETETFKNWFSGSKIVNDDGTPKIMYHGTPYGGFEEFKDWQYFTEDKAYADKYHNPSASSIRGRYNPATQPMTYEVYLSVKKPFDTRNPEIRKIWREEFYGNYSRTPLSEKGLPDWTDGIDLIDFIEENGYDYDGIILDEGAVGGYGDEVRSRGVSVVVRDSTQVKSATDNVGTFDPQNRNIKYSRREEQPDSVSIREYLSSMKPTERMTETEKLLLKKYQENLKTLEEKEKLVSEQEAILAAGATGEEKMKAINRRNIYRNQANRASKALLDAERSDGFARVMATSQEVVNRYLLGSAGTVADAADLLDSEIAGLNNQLKAVEADISKAAAGQRAAFARGLFDQKQLNAAATTLKNSYGSRMSAKSIADRLALAYGELYADSSEEGAKRFASAARDLAEDILRRSKFRYKSDVLDLLANEVGVISLTETDEQEIRNAGMTLSQYKKAIAPYIKVADSGSDLASYASNAEYFGQGALASILGDGTEGNLAMRLYEIISREKAMESEVAYEGMSEGQLIAETMADIAATNLPMSTNNKTIEYLRKEMLTYAGESAEAAKRIETAMTKAKAASARASNVWRAAVQEVNTAKAAVEYYRKLEEQRRLTELKEQKQEITDQLKSEYAKKLEEKVQKQRAEYREREKKAREYRYSRDELNKIRRRIGRNIKRLNTLRMRETDAKHVPQELQHVADLVMQTFTDSSLSRLAFSAEKTASLAIRYRLLQEVQSDETYYWDDEIETEIENLQALSEAYTAIRERSAGVPSYYSLEGVQLENEILQGVDNIVSNVLQMIDGRNDAFLRSRNETFEAFATKTGEEILAKDDYKLLKGAWGKWQTAADEMLRTGNMTPIYFMEHLNSPMVKAVFDEVREGQSYYAKIIAEGKEFVQNAKEKYHYGAWADDGKLKMKTGQGHVIELTREEAAEIYAIAKREKNNKLYQTEHLLYGGFQYKHLENKVGEDGKTVVKNTPNQLDAADIEKISRWLTDEQKAYADELVGFLSSTMANYGNQASMNMFGYKKFTESYYIPFHTAAEQRNLRGDEGPQGENAGTGRLKNSGFTKKLQNGANVTLMVGGLTDTVSEHIHKMATYAAMVEPIENMKRLMNHKVVEADGTANTIRALIGQKYGQASQNYMTQLLKDLNGAAQGDERATDLVNKMIGAFKRGAVMASASVVLQQPTAMARAMAMISPRYFAQNPLYRPGKGTWDEMMKYAGTAVIKDMGKFDVGMGLTASQYIADEHLTVMEAYSRMKNEGKWQAGKAGYKRFMDWLTAAPGKADQWTWGLIWKAVKAEQAAKNPGMDMNSEEFLQMCGERFDDVIDHTQVYDSVITRSNLMRSKNAFHKMATSFMSEPTLSINMLYDAVTGEHSGKKRAMIIGSVTASQVLAGALAALAQAWNDDEDKRNWLERYVDRATGNILDNINPLSMIPYVSDLMSMFEGYEVERPDMAAIGDLLSYGMNFIKKAADPEVKLGWKDYENFVGTLANMLGLPAKNISREMRRTRNLIVNSRWTTPDAFNVGQNVLENIPFYEDKNAAYYERIVAAELRGDTKKAEDYREYMLLSKMVNEEALKKGLKKAMQEEFIAGNADEEMAIDYLMKIGAYTEESEAYWEVDKWEYMRETGDKAESYRKYADFLTAVETGTNLKATIQEYLNNGVSKTTLASQISTNFRKKYVTLKKSGKGYADLQARLLTAYEALGYDRAKKLKEIQKWLEKTE